MSETRNRVKTLATVPFILEVEDADGSKFQQSYQLAYDFNSLAIVEKHLGVSMITDAGSVFENPTVKNLSILFYGALLAVQGGALYQETGEEKDSVIKLAEVRRNLSPIVVRDVLGACSRAYIAQLPADTRKRMDEMKKKAEAAIDAGIPAPLAGSPIPTPAS